MSLINKHIELTKALEKAALEWRVFLTRVQKGECLPGADEFGIFCANIVDAVYAYNSAHASDEAELKREVTAAVVKEELDAIERLQNVWDEFYRWLLEVYLRGTSVSDREFLERDRERYEVLHELTDRMVLRKAVVDSDDDDVPF